MDYPKWEADLARLGIRPFVIGGLKGFHDPLPQEGRLLGVDVDYIDAMPSPGSIQPQIEPAVQRFLTIYLFLNWCCFLDGMNPRETVHAGLFMPKWTLLDCVLLPSVIVGLKGPAHLLRPGVRQYLNDELAKVGAWEQASSLVDGHALWPVGPADVFRKLAENDEVPLAAWIGIPKLPAGGDEPSVVAMSLISGCGRQSPPGTSGTGKFTPTPGLGTLAKALGMAFFHSRGYRKLVGVTQFDNFSLRIHTRFGDLEILVPQGTLHNQGKNSFVYQMPIPSPDQLVSLLRRAPEADPEALRIDASSAGEELLTFGSSLKRWEGASPVVTYPGFESKNKLVLTWAEEGGGAEGSLEVMHALLKAVGPIQDEDLSIRVLERIKSISNRIHGGSVWDDERIRRIATGAVRFARLDQSRARAEIPLDTVHEVGSAQDGTHRIDRWLEFQAFISSMPDEERPLALIILLAQYCELESAFVADTLGVPRNKVYRERTELFRDLGLFLRQGQANTPENRPDDENRGR